MAEEIFKALKRAFVFSTFVGTYELKEEHYILWDLKETIEIIFGFRSNYQSIILGRWMVFGLDGLNIVHQVERHFFFQRDHWKFTEKTANSGYYLTLFEKQSFVTNTI